MRGCTFRSKPAGLVLRLIAWILDLILIGIMSLELGRYEVGLVLAGVAPLFGPMKLPVADLVAGTALYRGSPPQERPNETVINK
jgi:hypothetical protein